jgi:hypothetical protein
VPAALNGTRTDLAIGLLTCPQRLQLLDLLLRLLPLLPLNLCAPLRILAQLTLPLLDLLDLPPLGQLDGLAQVGDVVSTMRLDLSGPLSRKRLAFFSQAL